MTKTFTYDKGEVKPGETSHIRYSVSETYLGDSIDIPVSIINGDETGLTVFLSAAVHGDELNGIEVVRSVAREWNHAEVNGTIICMPVLNVPGFLDQQRYFPIQERDLNRAFPGSEDSTSTKRIAKKIWDNFISCCDIGMDFHTSTRGRTNMFHVRADLGYEKVERLARAFSSNVIIDTDGSDGMLRYEAVKHDIPTITVEMGQAHRFEQSHIQSCLKGVRSVFAEYNIYPQENVRWSGWTEIVDGWNDKTWIRADVGGLVNNNCSIGDVVYEDDNICTITNPFKTEKESVKAPYTGIVIGLLKNPVVQPGNPICHFVELDENTIDVIEMRRQNNTH
jgi:predicted deacylase